MDSNKEVKPLKKQFDFADVPSWYVLCHLFDRVIKMDYTSIRKGLTSYLHGAKFYYEYHHLGLNDER